MERPFRVVLSDLEPGMIKKVFLGDGSLLKENGGEVDTDAIGNLKNRCPTGKKTDYSNLPSS